MTEKIYVLEISALVREKLLKMLSQVQANSEEMLVLNEAKEALRKAEEKAQDALQDKL